MSASTAPVDAPVLLARRPPLVRGRARGGVVVLLCLFYAISYLDRTNISTAAPRIQADLGLTNAQLGLVLSAFSIPYAFFQVFGGWAGDRLGARRTLAWLSVVWAAATILTGLATGLVVLFVARLLLGFGEAAGFPTATTAMSRWLPAQLRGAGQGVVHAASRLATALAPVVVAALITATSWRTSFILVGGISLGWAAVWFWWYRDAPADHRRVDAAELRELAEGDAAASRRAVRTPWRRFVGPILPVAVVDFCYGWLFWVYLTWLPTVFKDSFGLALTTFALYTSLVLLGGVLGDLVGGKVADSLATRGRSLTWARRLPLVVGLSGSIVALVPGLLVHDLLVVTICLAVAFFFLETTNSTLWALPMDIAPDHAGAASGLMNTGYGLAGVASPWVFGLVLNDDGSNWPVPMAASVVLLAVGIAVTFLIDPRRRTDAVVPPDAPAAPAAP